MYEKMGNYGVNTVIRRFGGWLKALSKCGIEMTVYQKSASFASHDHATVLTDDLLADIRKVALLLQKESITCGEYEKLGVYSKSTCYKRFSTWNKVLSAAGLKEFKYISGKKIDDSI